MAAQASAVNVTAAGVVNAGPCTYRGFSINTLAASAVTLYDGITAAGTVLAKLVPAANGWFSDDITDGVRCTVGIYIDITGGPVAGHVRVG